MNMPLSLTPHQSQFLAHLLTLEGQAEEMISRSISSAKVDMNPHQVEAALFALRSPLSKGVILADEVGLGKTIEASLVIAQRWAERKRNILLIVPATLRKQWAQELAEKFSLPSEIIEAKNYNLAKKAGVLNPFDKEGKVLIASYQFAAKKAADIKAIKWGLVVFDEAHKLRNIYKKDGNKTAKALCDAVNDRHKALLSATPLQNSLMELFGLVSVIDENFFGSEAAFKSQFMASGSEVNLPILRKRLERICTRTLRRQVVQEGGIRFTRRHSLTQDFTPSSDEQKLYQLVSEYLQRDDIAAIKKGARHLVNLVIRKILASSSFAIGDTLKKMIDRLEKELAEGNEQAAVNLEDLADYELAEETAEEIENGDDDFEENSENREGDERQQSLKKEITELKEFRSLAQGIRENAKGDALIKIFDRAFEDVHLRGGARKAVIFTESVRTQQYLKTLLSENGYEGKLVLMNGSNADPDSQAVYRAWLERHKGTDLISGSKSSDTKAAIVEAFRDDAEILISTESGAEGVNLQFCSLVINYDLPWNPQRVEQRIGRCHRYGQKSDVVVVNFINKGNKADERVFNLLNKKFKLFDGVFGASDEILGAIESGVDIEKRIYSVLQKCRTTEEIEDCFLKLEEELNESLEARDIQTRKVVLENLDESVAERLRSRREKIDESLSDFERNLLTLTRAELPEADFLNGKAFQYAGQTYSLNWKEAEEKGWNFYRLSDGSLAQRIVSQAKERALAPATIRFHYDHYDGGQLADVLQLRDKSGWLSVSKLTISSLQTTEHLILAGVNDAGEMLSESQIKRLFRIPGQIVSTEPEAGPLSELAAYQAQSIKTRIATTKEENNLFFDEETEKLDRWGDEKKLEVQQDIDALDAEIKQARKGVRLLQTLDEKATEKRRIKQLEKRRDDLMMTLFERRKEVERKQEEMLDEVEAKMKIQDELTPLFTIRWELV